MKTTPAPASVFFKGRQGDPRLGERVQPVAIEDIHATRQPTIAILGAPDDTGVTRNYGRPGAKDGPDAVRAALYKFALPRHSDFDHYRLLDAGNVHVSDQILVTHERSYNAASLIATTGATVIAIGGGHDFAAPHILGTFSGVSQAGKASRFGVINVDPHLDVREFENQLPHSGTPFRQILESGIVKGSHLTQFGARDGRNARAHFEYCERKKVRIHEFADIRAKGDAVRQFKAELDRLTKVCDAVAVTIDMDSCADIEGVSAAPVIGFSPWELCEFARIAGTSKKTAILELAEIAPALDPTGRAARIGAEVIFHFILGRTRAKKKR